MSSKLLLVALVLGRVAIAADGQASPTFSKDVLPILQKNCQTCHRPGQIAPMSFLNPNRTVYYGEMTWEEMMFPFFGVVVEKNADPEKILVGRGPIPAGA